MKSTEATYSTRKSASRQSILELSAKEARAFFLKAESYCGLDLPHYIRFDALIVNGHLKVHHYGHLKVHHFKSGF